MLAATALAVVLAGLMRAVVVVPPRSALERPVSLIEAQIYSPAESKVDAIERQFRLGDRSPQLLADEFGVAKSSFNKRIKRLGWVADKSREVAIVADAILIQNSSGNSSVNATPTGADIKAAGSARADVVLRHRKDIVRARELFVTLIERIEVAASGEGQSFLKTLVEIVNSPEEEESPEASQRRADRTRKVCTQMIAIDGHIDGAKKLTETLEKLIRMEREAFGIAGEDKVGSEIDALLMRLGRAAS